jgi:hypothetical protein
MTQTAEQSTQVVEVTPEAAAIVIEAIAADEDKNRATKCGSILLRQVMVAGV